jgi:hypothetical protein
LNISIHTRHASPASTFTTHFSELHSQNK